MDDKDLISLSFWLGDKEIFHHYSNIYPSYHIGDTIWLERAVDNLAKFGNKERLILTKFRIIDVHHCIEQHYQNEIMTIMKIEVYLK